ncbi:MSCRAMM family protein [Amycolatopsis anabasis]|uniref:MSCRAMM family protein n=1 Tax=Amycolatopsis anabasis TaxID=1840409 RepID=UPI00131E3A41|nr:hypothetical protein [Amycolatopsis anabasis]
MGPVSPNRRGVLGFLIVCLLGAFTLVGFAAPAAADFKEKTGHNVPGQAYKGRPTNPGQDWLGSYQVGDQQVFCVQFQFKAPDTDEQYQPGDELKTKWGDPLAKDTAANISYLLLRYGDTKSNDEAAALAHLLHSWTSPAREGKDDLNPGNDFRHIGYDEKYHFDGLPAAAKEAVDKLREDAEANRGPWTAAVTPPKGEQTIGTPAEWTVAVRNAQDKGVPKVPVKLEVTDATLDGGKDTVTTGEDGTAKIKVTPTGAAPKLVAKLSGPADKPIAGEPVETNTQRVVSTGGEKELTAEGAAKARTQPGVVAVTKTNAKTGKGIAGVALRLTGKDKTAPATGQDDKPLVGADGKPAVVTTSGEEGKASVENLRTPQEICVVEVSPPDGFGQSFDPKNPPAACGEVKPGETLALEIKNVPNEVPRTIPAGNQPPAIAHGVTRTSASTGALAGVGALALLGSATLGLVARRRFGRR